MTATGYADPGYAQALAEFGTPRRLPRCGGWVLIRPIPHTPHHDAMGCYPLFSCADWRGLAADMADLADVVSVALVADPLAPVTPDDLRRAFPDVARPFKTHYVTDLTQPAAVSRHHRYYARRALRSVTVAAAPDPPALLETWTALYAELTTRHGLTGIRAFSRQAFAQMLALPGLVALTATHGDAIVAMQLWLVQGDVATSHLTAGSAAGYAVRATYALYWHALHHFAGRVRRLNWGGGAGLGTDAADSLAQFKRGWANTHRTALFCGRIIDHAAYAALADGRGDTYFPAYRSGEFGRIQQE